MGPCLGDAAEGAPRDTPQHTGLSCAPPLIPAEGGGSAGPAGGRLCRPRGHDDIGMVAGTRLAGGWWVPTRPVVSWLVLQIRGDEHEAL